MSGHELKIAEFRCWADRRIAEAQRKRWAAAKKAK
jgi:hypothetical protein